MGIVATCFDRAVRLSRGFRISFPADDLLTLALLVVRLFLALYLVAFLSIAGLIYTERWSQGAHVTPHMWAEHMEMIRLGYIDHHRHADTPPAVTGATSQQVLPFMPVWDALPEFPLAVDWTPMLASVAALLVALCVVGWLRPRCSREPFRDYSPPIPHRPPILATYS